MSNTTIGSRAVRELPERPNLEHLKNEAKQRLAAMRFGAPDAKLADAQFALAREYGFASWRELKAAVEAAAGSRGRPRAVGDWIGALPDVRFALHVAQGPDGVFRARLDSPDYGAFDIPVDEVAADEDNLSLALLYPEVNATYDGRWDEAAQQWSGPWFQNGVARTLNLSRGQFPPAPTIAGLDGVWDGSLGTSSAARVVVHVRTGAQGTFAAMDSPDRGGHRQPAKSISRDGRAVTIEMRTLTIAGELSEDGAQIDARFVRNGQTWPLVLRRRPRGAPPPRGPHPPAADIAADILARHVGEYRCGAMKAVVTLDGGALQVQVDAQPRLTVLAASPTEFFWRDLDIAATFELGADGRATGFVLRHNGWDSRYTRIA